MMRSMVFAWLVAGACCAGAAVGQQPIPKLEAQAIVERYEWLDNRDDAWFARSIPLLETPDPEIDATYYYRWELITKHVVYGAPEHGYAFTEFLDRPFWSGAYGAISCPAGHQLYELRWLRDPQWAEDYLAYWFRVPGAEPRRYSCWIADAAWAMHLVHPNREQLVDLYPDMLKNLAAWRERHWVEEAGMYWQTGHDDGMEWNINSRQTRDEIRGAPGFRPTLNSYLWADARALAKVARWAGDASQADQLEADAQRLKETLQRALWDPQRSFFFPQARDDEELDGHVVRAGSLTYQTGRYAGSPHGRELIGYVPWQFNLPDPGYEAAWQFLMNPDYFAAPFGPTTVERRDPLFRVQTRCCMWSGMSWPYATSQTLKALANVLQRYEQDHVSRGDYFRLLKTYTLTHRKDGRPYLAEACHPETRSWEGHDSFNHSEHYFHSGYIDLILTGLIGLQPQDDGSLVIDPLAPSEWDYFLVQDIPFQGRLVTVLWDRSGERYQCGAGLRVFVDGEPVSTQSTLARVAVSIEPRPVARPAPDRVWRNFAVNNSTRRHPQPVASHAAEGTPAHAAFDGQYWYLVSPGNRWTNAGSSLDEDWIGVDFGMGRAIERLVVYLLDDGPTGPCQVPRAIRLERWDDSNWVPLEVLEGPAALRGRRALQYEIAPITAQRIRVVAPAKSTKGGTWGVSELQAWGRSALPIPQPPDD